MINNLETRYSYVSEYLFINILNTINGRNSVFTDFLEEEGLMGAWLSLMKEKGLLNSKQVDKINESPIDIKKIQLFREQCRSFFLEPETQSKFLENLASNTEKAPLFFDKEFRPTPSTGGTEGLISLITYDMLTAHHNGLFPKIKKCKSNTCYALFVDTSGRRKWCSMEVCGNRTKVRKYYAKKNSE
ncbi:MAG: CGNR zinc finger domain-containing protein [Alkalibacterium sp.]|uniref:CGNR zinc finger domain-containing protein n=1 Tax=Alkalibacterium sp. TaxID=1872447 RepID=UPI003970DCBE